MPLTVRPHEMATGTRNPQAGEYPLDSLGGYVVYVPEPCAGTHRCPLVVFLHPGLEKSEYVVNWWRSVSDKYGTILLAPTAVADGGGLPGQTPGVEWGDDDRKNVDAAMQQVLRKFAIDPDKIAMIGYSGSGSAVTAFAGRRLDAFSRIVLVSTEFPEDHVGPPNTTTQFLLTSALSEARFFKNVLALKRAGHPVQYVVGLREHAMEAEDYDLLGHWLQDSWKTPDPAARPAPESVTDSVPLLTADVVAKMATFWTRFQQEPDSIRTTARLAHLRKVVVPVAEERPSVLMVDIPALAAQYPSVAADLEAAGLTARQHEAYRIALISAVVADFAVHGPVAAGPSMDPPGYPGLGAVLDSVNRLRSSGPSPIAIEATSVQGKNLEFTVTQKREGAFKALRETGMFDTP